MMKANVPPFDQILDWLEGRLSDEEAQALAERLAAADDAATNVDIEWLREFLEISRTFQLASPPPKVREALTRRFAAYSDTKRPPSFFQRVVAALTFDSRAQMMAAGVRSAAGEGQQRQLIYETDVATIALNIQPRSQDENVNLLGQIFPGESFAPDAFTIQLLNDRHEERGAAFSDDLGEFVVEAIPQGQYLIFILTEGYEIELPNVQLQS